MGIPQNTCENSPIPPPHAEPASLECEETIFFTHSKWFSLPPRQRLSRQDAPTDETNLRMCWEGGRSSSLNTVLTGSGDNSPYTSLLQLLPWRSERARQVEMLEQVILKGGTGGWREALS